MSPTSPTWYDVLGVSPDASTEEIKRAWREATDRFEPGSASGQFRMYNDAADVLLDPRRRAAYDATLEPTTPGATEAPPGGETPPGPVSLEKGTTKQAAAAPKRPRRPKSPESPESPESSESSEPSEPGAVTGGAVPAGERRPRRALVLTAVLAVLAVAVLLVAGWLGLKVRAQARVDEARTQAPAAAEQAAKAMLSYDYRTLPEDRQRASGYLTSDYRKNYLQTFRLLEKNKDGSPGVAVQSKTVVSANVMGSGIVDAEDDRARVLVYVNQTSRKQGADPQVFQNRVAMTMVRKGDRWLVANLKSY